MKGVVRPIKPCTTAIPLWILRPLVMSMNKTARARIEVVPRGDDLKFPRVCAVQ